MKCNQLNRFLAMMLTFVITFTLITPILAAGNKGETDKKSVSTKNLLNVKASLFDSIKTQDSKTEFSPEELELMRSALFELVDSNQELSTLLSPQGKEKVRSNGLQKDEDQFSEVRNQIQQMSAKELTTLSKVLNPTKMRAKLAISRATFDQYSNSVMKAVSDTGNRPTLPGIDSYCGDPIPTGVIIAADVVYFLAEAVRDIAQDGCNEVVVILGEGGNVRAVCLITDAIYIIAKAVYEAIHFCDDDYAASVGQASFDRLGHIHDDLEDSKANDNANTLLIDTHATTNKNTIVTNDNTNTTNIVNNDNANTLLIDTHATTNKNTIVTNDNANTLALTNLVNAALLNIISNANDNKDETKNLLLRTQIEADLSSTDGSTFVALYETPSSVCLPSLNDKGLNQVGVLSSPLQCGLLDLVRSIVRDTIANVGAGTNAQSFFITGDAQRAAGQYKAAYTSYRKAYKAASK